MEITDLLNDFNEVRECDFKGNHYSVRDNGAVYRHARLNKKIRKYDNIWTFGKQNNANGYMYLSDVRVHHLVATAYFGEHNTKVYVVDHKDSNRRNNRVENLHWLTRLENVLKNPATLKKIILCCGSIEAFLENPALIRRFANQNPDYSWMRNVSKEEAKCTLDNMNEWASTPNEKPKGGKIEEWIYKPQGVNPNMGATTEDLPSKRSRMTNQPMLTYPNPAPKETISVYTNANSPSCAVQKDWRTPTDFPLCPLEVSDSGLLDYYKNLSKEGVLTSNVYGSTKIIDYAINEEKTYIWVLCRRTEKNPIKPWSLAGIYVDNGKFVHENLRSFIEKKGGYKQFTLAQGKEWKGGDGIDDYC
jgi:hypothetical protein